MSTPVTVLRTQLHLAPEGRQDVLVTLTPFDEPGPYLGSSLWLEPQNPKAAAAYRELW
jgi:hypothetical protein